jgi:senataxin
LPATIFSENKDKTFFDRSFFERLVIAGKTVHTLRVQYRMHPTIRQFPSDNFYDKGLSDSNDILSREKPCSDFN